MTTKEGDHGRATYLHAHRLPAAAGRSSIRRSARWSPRSWSSDDARAAQLRQHRAVPLLQPGGVSAPASSARSTPRWSSATASGFDPSRQQTTTTQALKVQDLEPPGRGQPRPGRRPHRAAATSWQNDFVEQPARHRAAEPPDRLRPGRPPDAHRRRPRRSTSTTSRPTLRDAYGRNLFGQGCLLARRLVERGVPFVEVTLGDTATRPRLGHAPATTSTASSKLSDVLDPAWATLMDDLQAARPARHDADRLDGRVRPHAEDQRAARAATTGPTPGRTVLAGGGIKGGQVVGKTSADGIDRRGAARVGVPTSSPPSAWPWASTPTSRTRPTSAGRSASSRPTAKPIKEVLA